MGRIHPRGWYRSGVGNRVRSPVLGVGSLVGARSGVRPRSRRAVGQRMLRARAGRSGWGYQRAARRLLGGSRVLPRPQSGHRRSRGRSHPFLRNATPSGAVAFRKQTTVCAAVISAGWFGADPITRMHRRAGERSERAFSAGAPTSVPCSARQESSAGEKPVMTGHEGWQHRKCPRSSRPDLGQSGSSSRASITDLRD